MTPECSMLSDAQEQVIILKVVEKIQHLIPQHVKEHIKPIIQDLVNQDDSVLNATTYMPDSPSTHHENPSTLNQTISTNDFEVRISNLEDMVSPRMNEMEVKVCNLLNQKDNRIKELLTQVKTIQTEKNSLIEENTKLKSVGGPCLHKCDVQNLNKRMDAVETKTAINETKTADQAIQLDGQEQYGRQYIAEFEKVPYQGQHEDCIEVIIEFLRRYLGIYIRDYDISIAHRQVIPHMKKRLGRNYIPPIYCKFINRHVVHEIFRRRHLLKNHRNIYGQRFNICQNLTLRRRLIWDKVQSKLVMFKRKWVSMNGTIFVKKSHYSKPIKVNSEDFVDELLMKENTLAGKARSTAPNQEKSAPNKVPPAALAPSNDAARTANAHMAPSNDAATISNVQLAPSNDAATDSNVLPAPSSDAATNAPMTPSSNAVIRARISSFPTLHIPPFPHAQSSLHPFSHSSQRSAVKPPQFAPVQLNNYSYDDFGYTFSAYEKHQLSLGNRNSLMYPQEQRVMHSMITGKHAHKDQVFNGTSHNSRSVLN